MTAADRGGSWTQTYTGRQFFPMDPHPDDVDPDDIAHALSLLCRYNGHVTRFYSVAQHSVLLSRHFADPDLARRALLHDAAEAYVGDMVRPLKHHMPEYRAVEDRVLNAIGTRFGLPNNLASLPAAIKDADHRILIDERAALMPATTHVWDTVGKEPLGVIIDSWTPEFAESAFRDELIALFGASAVAAPRATATVNLFKPSGKWYCDEEWGYQHLIAGDS